MIPRPSRLRTHEGSAPDGIETGRRVQRFLVPLDGTPESEQVLPYALDLALRDNAVLGIVKVVPTGDDGGPAASVESLTRIEQQRDEARAYLERIARRLRRHGVQTTWEVRLGSPGEEIARAAETTAANVIVMASRNYTNGGPGQPGSVADAAIHAANIPVVVVSMSDAGPVVEDLPT